MTRIFGLAVTLVVAACASGSDRSELLSSWAPPPGQPCTISAEPERLPPASALVDLAQLGEGVTAALDRRSGYALFSLIQDETDGWERVAVIEGNLSDADEERLTEVLRPLLQTSAEQRHRLRLRIDLGDSVRVRVGRQESCPPVIRNQDVIRQQLGVIGARYSGQEAVVVIWALVNIDGTVDDFSMAQGTGDIRLNQEMLSVVPNMRFFPALNDRVPVPVWSRFPLRLNIGKQRR